MTLFQGSDEFVQRFLLPEILRKYGQSDIGGTFIADTLMNLNLTENSQMLPDQWSTVDAVTANKIKANGMRGDVGIPGHRHEPLAVQRPHRMEIGSDLCLNVVELNANLLDVAERPAERGDFMEI